ncbi:Ldh family oxidoreductase [Halomonas korlensis]|uniref:(2R)-3-sulfolactate dehydrogenase (NADP+) n=1 Tax=Halomonas korlensis TaxID=463301 RepID=A0A1I7KMN6_9GAMM|nr:Ldh family oxidoreductase [Halomonas korlensis]SFU98703.1 (2R)-3-sulfolactate dehydrogenase (NADP+) [Halomonas korlensis]
MDQQTLSLSAHEAQKLAEQACLAAGANEATARSLAKATVSAALFGHPGVGFPHLLDYLSGFRAGRINGDAEPKIALPLSAIIHSDAGGGIAQLGFDLAESTLVERTRELGVTIFTQDNSYTTGELGYYVRRLALEGLIAFAVSNSPAVVAGSPGGKIVFGTNPMAFAAPLADTTAPLVIDQASSATAFVNLAKAAEEGREIPAGWAIDETGSVTTDAAAGLRGALLAFGGAKGANVALMIECLAAGLSGASWSLDMPDFQNGNRVVDAGVTIIAIQPTVIDADFSTRLSQQLDRIAERGAYVPGRRPVRNNVSEEDQVKIDAAVLEAIRRSL